jgi:hypothetical protein
MKFRLLIFFYFFGWVMNGQMITAPLPLTIEANTANADAGNFVVNWANNTDNILISISLDYSTTGTSLSFPVNSGLTLTYGFSSWSAVSVINFYGTRDNINTALAAMTISMGASKTAVKINISATQYDSNYYYNAVNQHFYRYYASSGVTYATAKSNASTLSWKGKTGYLLTITSQSENDFVTNNVSGSNIWLACTDAVLEGNWKIDAGPENGTLIKTANGQTAGNIVGQYNNWCVGEPNDSSNEDYAVTKWNGGSCWNDVNGSNSSIQGYIVEFSADFPAGSDYTGVYSAYVVHNNDMAFTLNSTSALTTSTISNLPNLFGGLQVNNGHTVTVPSATTVNSNKIVFSGTGKMVFTDATSKWTPGTASATNTFTHSPATNTNPTYWSVSSSWVNDPFNGGASYPHYSPWINSYQGWSAGVNDYNQYIVLSYSTPVYITGIVTQGRANSTQWVTAGTIEVSLDGSTWRTILTNTSLNSDQSTIKTTLFPNVEYAQYVRVRPTNWYYHISMRLGLLIKQ